MVQQRQKEVEAYLQILFSGLEDTLQGCDQEASQDTVQKLLESVQMKILKPDITREEDSKIIFRNVSFVLIGLESLLSKIHLSITTRRGLEDKKLSRSVSIISGVINAASILENLYPLANILSNLKNSILDEGVDFLIDLKIQNQVSDTIKTNITKSKPIFPIVTKLTKKTLPSPKDIVPGNIS